MQAVHPHTRGEHMHWCSDIRQDYGSSPHPWGTRDLFRGHDLQRRFIPTPVGNTKGGRQDVPPGPVHPHTRGEHHVQRNGRALDSGSSPHPWGTRLRLHHSPRDCRFIPTPVGNTRSERCHRHYPAVHPHTRGEHAGHLQADAPGHGSSPHPWGTPQPALPASSLPRFIPTPVGNTSTRRPASRRRAVHPHTRGEHLDSGSAGYDNSGSSPHPWGTPLPYPIVLKKEKQQQNSTGPSGPRAAPGNEGRTHPTA